MTDFAELRERMVERQIAARGIRDPLLLDAFRQVPREEFVSSEYGRQVYGDHPLPIEAGQTISQPYIVALMIEAADVAPGDRVAIAMPNSPLYLAALYGIWWAGLAACSAWRCTSCSMGATRFPSRHSATCRSSSGSAPASC